MLSAASLRYRILTIERQGVQELPHVTLIATDSDQDTRRAVRALGEPSGFHRSAVATLGAVVGGGVRARVWQPARYGRGSTPVIAPDTSLAWLVDLAGRESQHPVHGVLPKRRPDWLSAWGVRATPPTGDDALADAVAPRLAAAEKRMLDLLAAWPLCTTEQLANLMGGLTDRRTNQLLRSLRQLGFAQRGGEVHLLSDEGLSYLARRDRAAVGPMLDRWSAERTEGSASRLSRPSASTEMGRTVLCLPVHRLRLLELRPDPCRTHELCAVLGAVSPVAPSTASERGSTRSRW